MNGSDLANIAYIATVLIFAVYGLNLWRLSRTVGKRPRGQTRQESGPLEQ